MENRRKPRQQRRLSCALLLDGTKHTGILRDVSEVGLFVQTRVKAPVGAELEIVFPREGEREELCVATRVARVDRLAEHFESAGSGGLGLELFESDADLGPLLGEAGFTEAMPQPAPDAQASRPFRVRLKAMQGPGMKTFSIRAPSRQSARSRALARAGRGWKVSEVCEA
ncbi:MAG: PilZ domain-containing protein [Myxococcota bacterium]